VILAAIAWITMGGLLSLTVGVGVVVAAVGVGVVVGVLVAGGRAVVAAVVAVALCV
jgi:hypothetical protein